jgi:dipeptidyl aminopeptidase/acylaminoacyl peptidase
MDATPEESMVAWSEFAATAPDLATRGRELFERTGAGEALLASVRDDLPPRIHPINVGIVDGKLLAFLIVGSGKVADLAADGRYALHAHQDPAVPHEFQVRGRAHEVHDRTLRTEAAAAWPFEVDDGYRLFEFGVEHAIFGERGSADDWPPVYTSWKAG